MASATASKKRLFLRWSLMAVMMVVAGIMCGYVGYFESLYVMDASRISFVILAIFVLFTVYSGSLAWRAGDAMDVLRSTGDSEYAHSVLRGTLGRAEHVWFGIALCEKLGLLGTLWGFLSVMMTGFQRMSSIDPQALKELLGGISIGVSTALLTTLVGLVCGLLLSVQHHDIVRAIEEVE